MRRIAEVMFWMSVLITVCCGCRWCGTDVNLTHQLFPIHCDTVYPDNIHLVSQE
jgi:hypothetical protein